MTVVWGWLWSPVTNINCGWWIREETEETSFEEYNGHNHNLWGCFAVGENDASCKPNLKRRRNLPLFYHRMASKIKEGISKKSAIKVRDSSATVNLNAHIYVHVTSNWTHSKLIFLWYNRLVYPGISGVLVCLCVCVWITLALCACVLVSSQDQIFSHALDPFTGALFT